MSRAAHIVTERGLLDGGLPLIITRLWPRYGARFWLCNDRGFEDHSIPNNGPGGLALLQQVAQKWGRKPGLSLERYAEIIGRGVVLFAPSNFGWVPDSGDALLYRGRTVKTFGDTFNGIVPYFGYNGDRWELRRCNIENGQVLGALDFVVGFTGTILLEGGVPASLEEIACGRRADLRNVFNFGSGSALQPLLVPALPHSEEAATRLAFGAPFYGQWVPMDPGSSAPVDLKYELENAAMSGLLDVEYQHDRYRLCVRGPLPLNRIPATVVGHDKDGQLLVLFVDGRQPKLSVGATVLELIDLAQRAGMVNALLGAAGSDVVLAEVKDEIVIHNYPSAVRPLPAVLGIIPPS